MNVLVERFRRFFDASKFDMRSRDARALQCTTFSYTYCRIILGTARRPIDYEILDANDAFASLLGLKAKDVVGHRASDFFLDIAVTERRWLEVYARVSETGKAEEYEAHSPSFDRWFRLSVSSPEKGLFVIISSDISKEVEFRREKDQYLQVLETIHKPLYVCDARSIIMSANPAFCELIGYAAEELRGKPAHFLSADRSAYLNYGFPEHYFDSLARRFSSIPTEKKDQQGDFLLRKKNGSLCWVMLSAYPLLDEMGTVRQIVCFPEDVTEIRKRENDSLTRLYETLANLAELRDDDTGNHMKRIGYFAALLARELGMDEKFCKDIALFAPLHDIGKVGIPDAILRKTSELTVEEYDTMKKHTTLGYEIVKGTQELSMAAEIILHHHERFDGAGYPTGLMGYAIPVSAQLTSLVDIYDALRSERPYKEAWAHEVVVKYIAEQQNQAFCPEIVETFLLIERKFAEIYEDFRE